MFLCFRSAAGEVRHYVLRAYATPSGISLHNDFFLLMFSSVLVLALQLNSFFQGTATSGKLHEALKEPQTRARDHGSHSHFHHTLSNLEQAMISLVFSFHICKFRRSSYMIFKESSVLLITIFTFLMGPNMRIEYSYLY